MPVYEYYCKSCDKITDLWMHITDSDEQECETCGSTMKRMIGKPTIELRGSGWARDLYSSSSKPKTNEEK